MTLHRQAHRHALTVTACGWPWRGEPVLQPLQSPTRPSSRCSPFCIVPARPRPACPCACHPAGC
eukprot:9099736-Lingulodinium_polyedra.AAC.1